MIDADRLRALEIGVVIYLVLLVGFLLFACVVSLNWRMAHDAPLLWYSGVLIAKFGHVPYRDIFDINAPGVLLLHASLARIVPATDIVSRERM